MTTTKLLTPDPANQILSLILRPGIVLRAEKTVVNGKVTNVRFLIGDSAVEISPEAAHALVAMKEAGAT